MSSERYYASLEDARELLLSRKAYRTTVEAWWGESGVPFPQSLSGEPAGVLARHLASFRYEDAVFVLLAERAGLKPVWLTYKEDILATSSPYKVSLLRPRMVLRLGRTGTPVVEVAKLACPHKNDGKRLSGVICNHGSNQPLPEHHESLLRAHYPRASAEDLSSANALWGGKADAYYTAYLSLFVAHGVLFEDYHGGESGAELGGFTERVFEPSFSAVEEKFGVRPVIVKLPWWRELSLYPDPGFSARVPWRLHSFALGEMATPLAKLSV